MSNYEKLENFRKMISPDKETDAVLELYLKFAKGIVLNRRYPFGTTETEVPPQYDEIQLFIAVELYSKRGAEGQNRHTENGISRGWESSSVSPSLLKMIVPFVGLVE